MRCDDGRMIVENGQEKPKSLSKLHRGRSVYVHLLPSEHLLHTHVSPVYTHLVIWKALTAPVEDATAYAEVLPPLLTKSRILIGPLLIKYQPNCSIYKIHIDTSPFSDSKRLNTQNSNILNFFRL